MTKHVLMVLTSADKMDNGMDTGMWLSEFGEAYLAFDKEGYRVTAASPRGGGIPVDERSLGEDVPEEILATKAHLENTLKLADIQDLSDFDAVFLPGGHGTMFDLPHDSDVQRIVRDLYEADKVVAAVCHGPAGLTGVMKSDGTPLVAGKKVTGFTNDEEVETTLDAHMPFLLETKLRELGGDFVGKENWADHVQVDGLLITGQNPQSTESVAHEVIAKLN